MHRAIRYFPAFLLLFHIIGIGLFLHFSAAPELSYLNIFMSAILVLLAERESRRATLVFLAIFVLGFVIELIGVQTGLLFGTYSYESSMGPLLFGTPVIIGATWYATIAGAASISILIRGNDISRSLLAGALAVLMDLFIERVAINYGLWNWADGQPPLFNYICWFIFGSVFAFIYLRNTKHFNKTAFYLFVIWLLFFSILTLF